MEGGGDGIVPVAVRLTRRLEAVLAAEAAQELSELPGRLAEVEAPADDDPGGANTAGSEQKTSLTNSRDYRPGQAERNEPPGIYGGSSSASQLQLLLGGRSAADWEPTLGHLRRRDAVEGDDNVWRPDRPPAPTGQQRGRGAEVDPS